MDERPANATRGSDGRLRTLRLLFCAALLLAMPAASHALTRTGAVGNVQYTVYAPDWTWQDREVNILVVLHRLVEEDLPVNVSLVFPPGKEADFTYSGKTEVDTVLTESGRYRDAFVGIKPLATAPRQVYPFRIRVRSGGEEAVVEYPLRTIRGAAVSPGKWAVLLPVAVALAWCFVFLFVLRRLSAPGAWRRPAAPLSEPETVEPWINRIPL